MPENETRATPSRSWTRRPWVPQGAVVLLALLAHSWVLFLPFQLDDYSHIALTSDRVDSLFRRLISAGAEQGAAPAGGYFFRPTMWIMNLAERGLSGATAAPALFHATSWLLHGLVTFLVWRLLASVMSRAGATVGAAFFALHPAGAHAVSWVSARGDLLLALFAVLAALSAVRLWRRGGSIMALVCGGAVAGALLSKMPAVVLIPLALMAVFLAPASIGLRFWRATVCFLPILLGLTARWVYLGTLMPTYAAGSSFSWGALPRMVESAPSMGIQILVPWNLTPDAAGLKPLLLAPVSGLLARPPGGGVAATVGSHQLVPAAMLLLAPFVALILSPIRHGGRTLLLLLVLSVCALPPLFLWTPNAFTVLGRTHYLLMVPLAALWGSTAATFAASGGPGRRHKIAILVVWLTLQLVVSTDALVHVARIESEAGRRVRTRLADIHEISARTGAGTCFVAVDHKEGFASMPMLGPLIEKAVRPPFTKNALDVKHVRSKTEIIFRELLTNLRGPVQVVEMRDGHFTETGPRLPAIPRKLPILVPKEDVDDPSWEPASPLPVRAIAGVRVRFRAGDSEKVVLAVTADGRTFPRELHLRASQQQREVVVGLDDDLEFLLTARLERISLRTVTSGGGPAPEVMGVPDLLSSIPALELVAPAEEVTVSYADHPGFRLRGVPPGSSVRLSIYFWLEPYYRYLKCTFPADRLRSLPGGLLVCRPDGSIPQETDHPGLEWDTVPAHLELLQRDFGIGLVMVRWRAEALGPGRRNVVARSPWSLFILRR